VHDSVLDRDVALALLKTDSIDEHERERILQEAQTMARMGEHPNVMPVYDLGYDGDLPFMVMPVMTGGSVETLLLNSEQRRLTLEQGLAVALGVCNGLVFAHSQGIVHRDLKPGNVWLTSDQVPRIGDFGLALSQSTNRMTSPDVVVGTPLYMSPEQIRGDELDQRTDLYSLGVMLYEMMAGTPPFSGDSPLAIIGQHLNTAPLAPTWYNQECPGELEALILRLLAKDAGARPQSAADVLEALELIQSSASGAQTAGTRPGSGDPLVMGSDSSFVGRDREMARLGAALEDSRAGRGRLAVLAGEPGVGKTRVARELEFHARLRGARVAWGRCYEEQGLPPYWPWVQVVRELLRDSDPEDIRSALGAGAPEIAEIVADVRTYLPDIPPPAKVDSPQYARFRLFESLTTYLSTVAKNRPLVILLDDLQWADQSSLMYLEFLAAALRDSAILLVGMYRDVDLSPQHPLVQTLGALTRETHFQRLALKGLGEDDVAKLIEVAAGIDPSPELVSGVYRQTEGNPLFVTEVVRLLAEEGELEPGRPGGDLTRVPDGVREVIGRRLSHLPAQVTESLTVASVIGHEFGLYELDSLVDLEAEDGLLDIMDQAVLSGVIDEVRDYPGRYRFTHILTQQALAGHLSQTRRTMLHISIGEALERLYANDIMPHAAELARHFGEAAALTGNERQIRYCVLAGEHALTTYAYEEALAHFQRAFEAKTGEASPNDAPIQASPGTTDQVTAEILFGLGRSQRATATFQMQEAWVSLSKAFEYSVQVGDIPQVVVVAEHLPVTEHMRTTEMLAHALTLVPSGSHFEGRLLSRYGNAINYEKGDYDSARLAFDRAMEIAKRENDIALEMRTTTYAACLDGEHLRVHESLRKSLRTVEMARLVVNPQAELLARFWAATAHYSLGESSHAVAHAAACLNLAERLRVPSQLTTALWTTETLARLQGDWEAAKAYSQQGLELAPYDSRLLASRMLLEYQAGDPDEGRVFLDRMLEVMRQEEAGPDLEFALPAIAVPLVPRSMGADLDAACEAARTVLAADSVTPSLALLAHAGLSLTAVERSDPTEAVEHYEFMYQYRGRMLYGGLGSVDRMLALICVVAGRYDDAVSHFEGALTFCRKAGYWPELAWTCEDYARFLKRRDRRGDQEMAATMIDDGIRIVDDLGMRRPEERVLAASEFANA
jgi:tetratricopeptide (TPR) repeat protein